MCANPLLSGPDKSVYTRPMRRHRAPKWLGKRCREYLERTGWIPGEDLRSPYAMVQATAALVSGIEGGSYRASASWIDHAGNLPGPTWDEDLFVAEPYRSAFYPEGEEQLKRFIEAIGVAYTVTEPGEWHPDTVRIAIYNVQPAFSGHRPIKAPYTERQLYNALYNRGVKCAVCGGVITAVSDADNANAVWVSVTGEDSGPPIYITHKVAPGTDPAQNMSCQAGLDAYYMQKGYDVGADELRDWMRAAHRRWRQGRKGQGMASAFEATVQLYKNDHGVSIVTDAVTVESFEQALAKVIAEDWTEYDAGLLVPQVREILNKLQSYKSNVIERRLLIAGQSMPAAVDLRFTTGPGLPNIELAPSNNGEVATV